MTVLLVLFTFVAFLLIDYFRTRNTVPEATVMTAAATKLNAVPRLQPALVAGFAVPENLRYHPSHIWALSESTNLVRLGIDDFASKLAAKVEHIALPQRGQWIRQGQKMCTSNRDGATVDLVSPIEGTVSDINEEVARESEASLERSLRRRLAGNCPSARCKNQLQKSDRRPARPLVARSPQAVCSAAFQ